MMTLKYLLLGLIVNIQVLIAGVSVNLAFVLIASTKGLILINAAMI